MKKKFIYLFVAFFVHGCNAQHVRLGVDLAAQEEHFLTLRHAHCKYALEQLLGTPLQDNQVPRIALCLSGGGYRAMISSLGFLQGLGTLQKRSLLGTIKEKFAALAAYIGLAFFSIFDVDAPIINEVFPTNPINSSLLDATSYCATLSGSAWGMAGWMQSNMMPGDYLNHISPNLNSSLAQDVSWSDLISTLKQRIESKQPISLIDIYGIMLGQKLLCKIGAENPGDFTIAMQAEKIETAAIPFPIFSALIGADVPRKEWAEFTPYEIGSEYQHAFIPTSLFGSSFKNGLLTHQTSPESLSFLLGLWGSAFCLNVPEFIAFLQRQFPEFNLSSETSVENFLTKLEIVLNIIFSLNPMTDTSTSLLDYRPFAPKVSNWAYGMPGVPTSEHSRLTLVDAGIDFRIPIPPLLRAQRAIDIIIIVDASDLAPGSALQSAQDYAKSHNVLFPPIDYTIINNPCSVHKDANNPKTPVVLYFPLVANPTYENGWDPRTASFAHYTNFQYTTAEINLLSGLMKRTALQYQNVILDTIKEWVERRN